MSGRHGVRVADRIQRVLAEAIRTELRDPRVGFVTLTDALVEIIESADALGIVPPFVVGIADIIEVDPVDIIFLQAIPSRAIPSRRCWRI